MTIPSLPLPTRSLTLALASVFVAGFWLSTVTASAEQGARNPVIVIGARAAPVLM